MARFVKMTAMPQMVGLFNGFGGLASGLVAAAEYLRYSMGVAGTAAVPVDASISIMLGTDESITEQEKQWVGEAVAWLRSQGYGNAVVGHRDTFPTACPGNSIYQAIPDIKKYAAGGVPEEPEEPEIERTPDMAFVTSVGSRRQLHYENGITVAITDTEATALKKAGLPMAGLSTASFNSFRSVGQVVLSAFDRQGEQVSNVNLTNINPPLSEDE